jgi:hypothetical protein
MILSSLYHVNGVSVLASNPSVRFKPFPRTRGRATSFTIATAPLPRWGDGEWHEHREDPHRPSFPVAEKLARLSLSFIPPNSA